MAEWWKRIDRDRAIQLARTLVPNGGCLVLTGGVEQGHVEALALVGEVLEQEFGYDPRLIVTGEGQPNTVEEALLAAWERVRPPPIEGIAPWVAEGQSHAMRITQLLANDMRGLGGRFALLFGGIDHGGPIPPGLLRSLPDLAQRAGIPVIVGSWGRSSWAKVVGVDHVYRLRGFKIEDVRQCLYTAGRLGSLSTQELDKVLADLVDPADNLVEPSRCYARLMMMDQSP